MKIMKALIVKDLYQLKSYWKTVVLFILVFALMAYAQSGLEEMGIMLIPMTVFGLGIFTLSSLSYDEASSADAYLLTFPVTREEIVKAKYAFAFLGCLVGVFIGLCLNLILTVILAAIPSFHGTLPQMTEIMMVSLASFLGLGFLQSVKIPITYKFGVEKGKFMTMIFTALFALMIVGLFFVGKQFHLFQSMPNLEKALLPLLIVGIIVEYGISYVISKKIYLKKEL